MIHKGKFVFYSFFIFVIISFNYVIAAQYSDDDYFEIARSISSKNLHSKDSLNHVLTHHTGKNKQKSFFYIENRKKMIKLIEEVLKKPTGFSVKNNTDTLMIYKKFSQQEINSLFNIDYIGEHVDPSGKHYKSNSVAVFFSFKSVLNEGDPWDGSKGHIKTSFPLFE